VSWIKASASVTSGHTNRAAVAEKSIGEPTFDLTGAPVTHSGPSGVAAPHLATADGRASLASSAAISGLIRS